MAEPVSATVDYLPIWKKNATTGERLRELALIADKHPERFERWVIVYMEIPAGQFRVRHMSHEGSKTIDCLGILDAGAKKIWDESFE